MPHQYSPDFTYSRNSNINLWWNQLFLVDEEYKSKCLLDDKSHGKAFYEKNRTGKSPDKGVMNLNVLFWEELNNGNRLNILTFYLQFQGTASSKDVSNCTNF